MFGRRKLYSGGIFILGIKFFLYNKFLSVTIGIKLKIIRYIRIWGITNEG